MKKCIYCNKAIDDHFRICPYCGENQEYTTALPVRHQSLDLPLRKERKVFDDVKRPEHYTLLVFTFNSLLLSGTSYLLTKQWKILPLVFLALMALQGGLAMLAYGLRNYGFKQKIDYHDFMDLVGDYSLPGILGCVLLLFLSFVVKGLALILFLMLIISMILVASLSVLLGPAKRIFAVMSLFIYLILVVLFFISRWFGVSIIFQ